MGVEAIVEVVGTLFRHCCFNTALLLRQHLNLVCDGMQEEAS